jgi:hypothetical protein
MGRVMSATYRDAPFVDFARRFKSQTQAYPGFQEIVCPVADKK